MPKTFFVVALGFLVAAAGSRFLLQHTQSRLQIAVFLAIALVAEAVSAGVVGRPPNLAGPLANGLAAAAGVMLVKWWLEGSPFH